jgi:hypothetical protein
MGISTAPFYLQRNMESVFADMIDNGVQVYLDDIVAYGADGPAFLQVLREIFSRSRKVRLRFKPAKVIVGVPELKLLGHVVNGEGVRSDNDRINDVLGIPFPRTTKELRRLLGVTNFMRRFIPRYSEIVAPLSDLVNAPKGALDTPAARAAFKALLMAVRDQLSVVHIRYDLPIEVIVDASTLGCGAILINIYPDGSVRVIACCSHKFTEAEHRWKTIEQE